MKSRNSKESINLVDSIVNHSKDIIILKIAWKNITNARFILTHLKSSMYIDLDRYDKIIDEIRQLIKEKEKHIKNLINPLLKGNDYDYHNKYSFNAEELSKGFAILEKVVKRDKLGTPLQKYDCALLLVDAKKDDLIEFKKGSIISIRGNEHILNNLDKPKFNLKTYIEKNSTLIKYVSKAEYEKIDETEPF